ARCAACQVRRRGRAQSRRRERAAHPTAQRAWHAGAAYQGVRRQGRVRRRCTRNAIRSLRGGRLVTNDLVPDIDIETERALTRFVMDCPELTALEALLSR